jgi:hypothetical protein
MNILRTFGESDCHVRDLSSCIFDVSSSPVLEHIHGMNAPAALQQIEPAEFAEVEARLLRTYSGRRAGSASRAQRPTQPNGKIGKEGN